MKTPELCDVTEACLNSVSDRVSILIDDINPLLREYIKEIKLVIFGSTALNLHGYDREYDDIDVYFELKMNSQADQNALDLLFKENDFERAVACFDYDPSKIKMMQTFYEIFSHEQEYINRFFDIKNALIAKGLPGYDVDITNDCKLFNDADTALDIGDPDDYPELLRSNINGFIFTYGTLTPEMCMLRKMTSGRYNKDQADVLLISEGITEDQIFAEMRKAMRNPRNSPETLQEMLFQFKGVAYEAFRWHEKTEVEIAHYNDMLMEDIQSVVEASVPYTEEMENDVFPSEFGRFGHGMGNDIYDYSNEDGSYNDPNYEDGYRM